MDLDARLGKVAERAMLRMEDMIVIMEAAAEQIASGSRLEDVCVGRYRIYALSNAEGSDKAIICALSSDDYFDLFSAAADEEGVSLENMTRLDVQLPEAEFETGMVTGSFYAFKGISVEMRNRAMELLIDIVSERLKKRGLAVGVISEDVIFYMPAKKRR